MNWQRNLIRFADQPPKPVGTVVFGFALLTGFPLFPPFFQQISQPVFLLFCFFFFPFSLAAWAKELAKELHWGSMHLCRQETHCDESTWFCVTIVQSVSRSVGRSRRAQPRSDGTSKAGAASDVRARMYISFWQRRIGWTLGYLHNYVPEEKKKKKKKKKKKGKERREKKGKKREKKRKEKEKEKKKKRKRKKKERKKNQLI